MASFLHSAFDSICAGAPLRLDSRITTVALGGNSRLFPLYELPPGHPFGQLPCASAHLTPHPTLCPEPLRTLEHSEERTAVDRRPLIVQSTREPPCLGGSPQATRRDKPTVHPHDVREDIEAIVRHPSS